MECCATTRIVASSPTGRRRLQPANFSRQGSKRLAQCLQLTSCRAPASVWIAGRRSSGGDCLERFCHGLFQ